MNRGVHIAIVAVWMSLAALAQQQTDWALAAAVERAVVASQIGQARRAVEQLLAQPHVELEILLETGARLADRELFELAHVVFARGVIEYPRSFEARYNLALADFALRNYSEAQKALDGFEQLSKEQQPACEYLRGKVYDALGQSEPAERFLTAAFRGAPEQENYALDLGLFYLRWHLYAKAMETLETGEKYHPDSIYMLLGLGLAQVFGDDPPRAVATCRKILARDPDYWPARLLMAAALYMHGENQNCLKETEAVVGQPGTPPYFYYLHAAVLLRLNAKDYGAMLRDLDAANRGIPYCTFCYFTQSKVHQEMGDEAAGIADLETLVGKVAPEFSQGWYRLATLYQRAGRPNDAAKALGRFRALKTEQTDRETAYMQQLFLSAIGTGLPVK